MHRHVIFCGDRAYLGWQEIRAKLTDLRQRYRSELVVVSGGARGADMLAKSSCIALGIEHREILADWVGHGRAAGPIRNQQMLDEGKPDLVVAFPGGTGTADMVRRAKAAGVRVIEVTA